MSQGKHGGGHPTPNDNRSIVKNPNNPAYAADLRNRETQRQELGEGEAGAEKK